jgi:hypothetical protein
MKLITMLFGVASALLVVIAGCERKEKVLDIETPGADIEVERSVDDGDVEVSIDDQ